MNSLPQLLRAGCMLLGLAVFTVGCQRTSSTKESGAGNGAQTLDFGGLGFDAEDAQGVQTAFDHTADTAGQSEDDSEVDALLPTGPDVRTYLVRILWGQLTVDLSGTPTTWDGDLSVSEPGAGIRVLRTYGFESFRGDRIVRPRSDATTLSWESETSIHHDGVLVWILIPESSVGTATVTLTTPLFTLSLSADDLEDHEVRTGDLDNTGNEVAWFAQRVDTIQGGFLAGHWDRANAHGGTYYGRWIGFDGALQGLLRGHFERRAGDGLPVFYGKVFDPQGEVIALLRGVWTIVPFLPAGGFLGTYWTSPTDRSGIVAGHWVDLNLGPEINGHFGGVWRSFFQSGDRSVEADDERHFDQP